MSRVRAKSYAIDEKPHLVKSSSKLLTISSPGSDGTTGGVTFFCAKRIQSVFAKKSFALMSSQAANPLPQPSRLASVTFREETPDFQQSDSIVDSCKCLIKVEAHPIWLMIIRKKNNTDAYSCVPPNSADCYTRF